MADEFDNGSRRIASLDPETIAVAKYLFPRTTVDWDTSQADDIRTRGVSWMNKRQMDRGRAPRSDRKSLA
jgi:hypothetical protein